MLKTLDINDPSWLDFISTNEKSTIFHHPCWLSTIKQTYGYNVFILTLRDNNHNVLAGMPIAEIKSLITGKRFVALPFSDHCKVLALDNELRDAFFTQLFEYTKPITNTYRIELRDSNCTTFEHDFTQKEFYLHLLKLDKPLEIIYSNFRKKGVKYCIKKALKNDVIIKNKSDEKSVMQFFTLHSYTRKKLGVPTQPKKYFKFLYEKVIMPGYGYTSLAYHNNQPISGSVFLIYNKQIIYKYGASHPSFMRFNGNHLLLWENIKWACENGYKSMDLGRTDLHQQNLRQFKLGWGTFEEKLLYTNFGKNSHKNTYESENILIKKFLQKGPILLNNAIGSILYRHFG